MKLQGEVTFLPGYYMGTFKNGQAIIVEDPEYNPGENVMEGEKIAIDGIDVDGGIIYIDMDDVRIWEPVSLTKVEQAKQSSAAKAAVMRISAQIELKNVMHQGQQLGIIEMPTSVKTQPPEGTPPLQPAKVLMMTSGPTSDSDLPVEKVGSAAGQYKQKVVDGGQVPPPSR